VVMMPSRVLFVLRLSGQPFGKLWLHG